MIQVHFTVSLGGCTFAGSGAPSVSNGIRTASGFIVEGIDGVFTALHGVSGCEFYSLSAPPPYQGLVVTGVPMAEGLIAVSPEADLALLANPNLTRYPDTPRWCRHSDPGDEIDYIVRQIFSKTETYGSTPRQMRRNPQSRGWEEFQETVRKQLQNRGSPDLSGDVIELFGHLTPGASGSAVVDFFGYLHGIAIVGREKKHENDQETMLAHLISQDRPLLYAPRDVHDVLEKIREYDLRDGPVRSMRSGVIIPDRPEESVVIPTSDEQVLRRIELIVKLDKLVITEGDQQSRPAISALKVSVDTNDGQKFPDILDISGRSEYEFSDQEKVDKGWVVSNKYLNELNADIALKLADKFIWASPFSMLTVKAHLGLKYLEGENRCGGNIADVLNGNLRDFIGTGKAFDIAIDTFDTNDRCPWRGNMRLTVIAKDLGPFRMTDIYRNDKMYYYYDSWWIYLPEHEIEPTSGSVSFLEGACVGLSPDGPCGRTIPEIRNAGQLTCLVPSSTVPEIIGNSEPIAHVSLPCRVMATGIFGSGGASKVSFDSFDDSATYNALSLALIWRSPDVVVLGTPVTEDQKKVLTDAGYKLVGDTVALRSRSDPQWQIFGKYAEFLPRAADQFGLTKQNVDEVVKTTDNSFLKQILNVKGESKLGDPILSTWAYDAIKEVGGFSENYLPVFASGAPKIDFTAIYKAAQPAEVPTSEDFLRLTKPGYLGIPDQKPSFVIKKIPGFPAYDPLVDERFLRDAYEPFSNPLYIPPKLKQPTYDPI
tara:strand:+ start:3409 stop:5709 length:2301 start_codon:yes stop_codon:yes gene_type:complete